MAFPLAPIEPMLLKFVRTLCGLEGITPRPTCANALFRR